MNRKSGTAWKVLIFDWDGTLMDSEARIVDCLRAACLHYDLPDQHDDVYKNVIGLGLREALCGLHPQVSDEQIQKLAEYYRNEYLFHNTMRSPPCIVFFCKGTSTSRSPPCQRPTKMAL